LFGKGAIFLYVKVYFNIMEWEIQHKKEDVNANVAKGATTLCVL
jgi:hypothetical protein